MPDAKLIPELRMAFEDAQKILTEEFAYYNPRIEGWRDQEKLVRPDTRTNVVEPAIRDYQRRIDALNNLKLALDKAREQTDALENDGHPTFPARVVNEQQRADLEGQKKTIDLTVEDIADEAATSLNVKLGAPQPK